MKPKSILQGLYTWLFLVIVEILTLSFIVVILIDLINSGQHFFDWMCFWVGTLSIYHSHKSFWAIETFVDFSPIIQQDYSRTFEAIFDITQFLSRIHIGIWRIWFFCFWIWIGSDRNQFSLSDFQTAPFRSSGSPLLFWCSVGWLSTLQCSVNAPDSVLLNTLSLVCKQRSYLAIWCRELGLGAAPRQSGPMLGVEESQLLSWIWLVDIVDSQSPARRHI